MLCAPAKVHDLLRVARCEIRGAAHMSRISRAAGIAAPQRVRDTTIVDRAGVAALARRQKLAVPAGERHPHFELDVGVARRLDRSSDPACGRVDWRRSTRWIECPSWYYRGNADGRVR